MPGYMILEREQKSRSLENLKIKRNDTKVQSKSMSKLRSCVLYWFKASKIKVQKIPGKLLPIKYRLNFITLTLPSEQKHSDTEIKKHCLNQFITELRRDFELCRYVWKAELQSNGNIHFHIITDIFIDYTVIRDKWNRCLEKLGYISEFEKTHNHRNPNSTDIKTLKSSRQGAKYICKYIGKSLNKSFNLNSKVIHNRFYALQENKHKEYNQENLSQSEIQFQGKKCAISEVLGNKTSNIEIVSDKTEEELKQLISHKSVRHFDTDFCTVITFDSDSVLRKYCPGLYTLYSQLLLEYRAVLN